MSLCRFSSEHGISPSCCDRDVWMHQCEEADGYDYICTQVDDFKIVARIPEHWMKLIKDTFTVKDEGTPKYYVGNDYWQPDPDVMWQVGSKTYIKEAIAKLEERKHGTISKCPIPMTLDCHPELDDSPLLGDDD